MNYLCPGKKDKQKQRNINFKLNPNLLWNKHNADVILGQWLLKFNPGVPSDAHFTLNSTSHLSSPFDGSGI